MSATVQPRALGDRRRAIRASRRGDLSARVLRRAGRRADERRSPRPCRCRTRPKKVRGAAFWCGRRTTGTAEQRAARARRRAARASITRIPDHPARPSQFDLDHAWPTFAYVIVSVASGVRARDMTVWFCRTIDPRSTEGTLHHGDDTILIPTPLRPFTDKQDAVEADGATVGELLADLTAKHSGPEGSISTTSRASCAASSTST